MCDMFIYLNVLVVFRENIKNKLVLGLKMQKTNDVIGLGSALMDFLIEVDEDKLLEFNLKKGEMHLVEEEKASEILQKINDYQLQVEYVPGGSSANTLKGMALLGSKVIFCGKVGSDDHGLSYEQQMNGHGVDLRLGKQDSLTGHSISFITPDSERTFATHLGAAINLVKEDILEEDIANSKILHLEGYQLEGGTKDVVLHAIELAKKNNTLISLDLADPGLIRRNMDFFQEIIGKVDIAFLNETEAKEFTGLEPEEAVVEIGNRVKVAVVKIGKEGSLVSADGIVTYIPGFPAEAVDTTGAGDTFAAGFLYGYCQGWEMEKAGKLGSLMAARIVEKKGVKIDELDVEEIQKSI